MDAELMDAVLEIAAAVLTLLGVLITGYLVPWLKANTSERVRRRLWNLAQASWTYVENNYPVQEQKERAIERLRERAKEYGLKPSEEDMQDLIESAKGFGVDFIGELVEE